MLPSGVVAFLLFAAPIAMADDPIGDAAGSATDTVNTTAGSATDTVNTTAGSATDTVNTTAGSATNAVGANQITQTRSQAGNTLTFDGGTASSPLQSTPSAESRNTPSELSAPLAQDDPDPQTDPCNEDSSLVCLGLLYGLGEATDTGADVLGALVRTGGAVIVLAAIALLLGILGTAALAASRSGFSYAAGRVR
jgi:hypothetical protein